MSSVVVSDQNGSTNSTLAQLTLYDPYTDLSLHGIRHLSGCRSECPRAARGNLYSQRYDRSWHRLSPLDAVGDQHRGQFRLVLRPGRGIALRTLSLLRGKTETAAGLNRERGEQGLGFAPALCLGVPVEEPTLLRGPAGGPPGNGCYRPESVSPAFGPMPGETASRGRALGGSIHQSPRKNLGQRTIRFVTTSAERGPWSRSARSPKTSPAPSLVRTISLPKTMIRTRTLPSRIMYRASSGWRWPTTTNPRGTSFLWTNWAKRRVARPNAFQNLDVAQCARFDAPKILLASAS